MSEGGPVLRYWAAALTATRVAGSLAYWLSLHLDLFTDEKVWSNWVDGLMEQSSSCCQCLGPVVI